MTLNANINDDDCSKLRAFMFDNVPGNIACRTGVIFCVFQANRGKSEASAKRELRARGGSLKNVLPSHATRARLAFASVSLKYTKSYACSAGYRQHRVFFKL